MTGRGAGSGKVPRTDPAAGRAAAGRAAADAPSSVPLVVAGLTAGGWLLLLVTTPVAVFLTWWGDCFEEICPSAGAIDRAAYVFDFAAILVLPAIGFGAYRGWRPAAVALIVSGLLVVAQVVASALGARGFQAFPLLLPAGALLVAAGIVALRPGSIAAFGGASTSRRGLIGLGVLSLVIVAIAFQGVLTGGGGIGQVILVLMAVSLTFIALVAVRNRSAPPPPPPRPSGQRRR
jgi:hypothetical protein